MNVLTRGNVYIKNVNQIIKKYTVIIMNALKMKGSLKIKFT